MKKDDIVLTPDLDTALVLEVFGASDPCRPTLARVEIIGTGIVLVMPCPDLEPLTRSLYEEHSRDFHRKLKRMEEGVDIIRRRPQS